MLQNFNKIRNTKFHKNSFSISLVVYTSTYELTNMAQLVDTT